MATTIDTLNLAKRLREALDDEERAEIFAEGLREVHEARVGELVTKAELALAVERLERRIDGVEGRHGVRIDGTVPRTELPQVQPGARDVSVAAKIDRLAWKLTIRLGGMMVATLGIVAILLRFG